MEESFAERVYAYVMTVPKGRVVSYGQVARAIGCPRAARQVGRALHNNPRFGVVPCHRVLFQNGSLAPAFAFGGTDAQRALLEAEGVVVSPDGFVDMKKYRWEE